MLRSLLTASIVACATFSAAGAFAQEDHQISVSARDVDFNNPSEVRAFYGRIRTAADVVCTSQGPVDMATSKYEKACIADAVRDAVDQVNEPQLTAMADGQSGANAHQLALRDNHDDDRAGQ